jgi:HK97 gp10 family phage protein
MIYATLISRIPEIIGSLDPKVKEALEEGAELIAKDAQTRVPVATGALRDAIHVEEIEDGYSVVAGDDEAFYGHIVEHGGVNTPAHPFLIPAGEARWADIEQLVEDVLEDL